MSFENFLSQFHVDSELLYTAVHSVQGVKTRSTAEQCFATLPLKHKFCSVPCPPKKEAVPPCFYESNLCSFPRPRQHARVSVPSTSFSSFVTTRLTPQIFFNYTTRHFLDSVLCPEAYKVIPYKVLPTRR